MVRPRRAPGDGTPMSERARPPSERRWAASSPVFVTLFLAWLALYQAIEPAGGQPRPGDAQIVSEVLAGQDRLHAALTEADSRRGCWCAQAGRGAGHTPADSS